MVLRLANGQLESSARCPNIKKSHCKLEFLFFFFFFLHDADDDRNAD